jgi:hypothetical protein
MPRSSTGGPLDQAATAAVRRYVDALRTGPPPASRRLRDAVQRRLREIEVELPAATPMQELQLVQERRDLLAVVAWYELEDDFVEVARAYSRRHGITYGAWREIGVSAAVLRRAGVPATGGGI